MNAVRKSEKNAMKAAYKARQNAKFLFWSLIFLVTLVVQIITSVVLVVAGILLHRWLGIYVNLGGYAGFLGVPAFFTAFITVAAIGRRYGFVEPRRTETLQRIVGSLPAASVETVELRTPDSLRKQLWVGLMFVSGLIAVLAVATGTNPTRIYAFAASGVFFALSLLVVCLGRAKDLNFVVRIDKSGVDACQGFRRHSAVWQDIEAVEIVTISGAPGAPVTRTYALFGHNAKRLFWFNLLYVPPAEQDKFERVLREAFQAQAKSPEMIV